MEKIDIASWERREIYELFSGCSWPFYSVTLPLEVTNVKKYSKARGLSFYHTMVWVATRAINSVPAFRLRIRGEDVVRLDVTHPSFTTLRAGAEAFQIISIPYEEELESFCAHAKEKCETQRGLFDQEDTDEYIYFSCLPWADFTALTNERDLDMNDAIPRIAWGKYAEEKGGLWLHVSIEVNHRTVDGFHIGKLKEALDREIAALGE